MNISRRVLVVEDNPDMRNALSSYLSGEGFKVKSVDSTEEGIDAVDENDFEIGLIDINLPGKSGFDLIEYIREKDSSFPLIALTARDGIEDKLKGFGLGLNDYVVKPFNLEELKARINAHLAQSSAVNLTAEIQTQNYRINPLRQEFFVNDKSVELTQIEFKMMQKLMINAGIIVNIDDLIEFTWGESDDLITPPIRIHIANLRKKINDTDFKIIKTIPGKGYILND